MSLEATVWALTKADVGDAIAKLVLVGLANHADAHGRAAWPSQATLSAYAEVSDRTIRTKLAYLEQRGLIRPGDQRHVAHVRGDRRPMVWDLIMTSPETQTASRAEAASTRGDHFRPEAPAGREGSRAEADDSHGRKRSSDKPSLEPSSMETRGGYLTRRARRLPPRRR